MGGHERRTQEGFGDLVYIMASKKVTTTTVSASALTKKMWGAEYNKPDVAYVFSNGKKFVSTDRSTTGVYRKP